MKFMKKLFMDITLISVIVFLVLLTACTSQTTDDRMLPRPVPNGSAQIANPASKYCVDNGGKLEIRTADDGSQTEYCTLTDGTVCEEWAFMRGECPKNMTQPIDKSFASCSDVNGTYDPQYRECSGISKVQCDSINGTFNECASACRHDPKAELCTMQCVIVCQLK